MATHFLSRQNDHPLIKRLLLVIVETVSSVLTFRPTTTWGLPSTVKLRQPRMYRARRIWCVALRCCDAFVSVLRFALCVVMLLPFCSCVIDCLLNAQNGLVDAFFVKSEPFPLDSRWWFVGRPQHYWVPGLLVIFGPIRL